MAKEMKGKDKEFCEMAKQLMGAMLYGTYQEEKVDGLIVRTGMIVSNESGEVFRSSSLKEIGMFIKGYSAGRRAAKSK